jgi:hypothetical protein
MHELDGVVLVVAAAVSAAESGFSVGRWTLSVGRLLPSLFRRFRHGPEPDPSQIFIGLQQIRPRAFNDLELSASPRGRGLR